MFENEFVFFIRIVGCCRVELYHPAETMFTPDPFDTIHDMMIQLWINYT